MSDPNIEGYQFKPGFKGMATDTASDQTMFKGCLLYTSPSPRDRQKSRMPSSA